MATIINMPRLSDTMTEGTVATWLKKVGDKIPIANCKELKNPVNSALKTFFRRNTGTKKGRKLSRKPKV